MHVRVFWAWLGLARLCLADHGTLSLRTYRNHEKHAQALRKRDMEHLAKRSPFTVDLGNIDYLGGGFYYVNASVGTPVQEVQLDIDTGSSDIWMFGVDSCDQTRFLCAGGVFDESASTSITIISQGTFKIQYFTEGSGVTGDYITDNFGIGTQTINNLTMGVASKAVSVNTGIMGIGFDTNEAAYASDIAHGVTDVPPYANLLDVMKSQGLVDSRSYSLYLDDLEAATGSIVFGGYDKAKFQGDLGILDIQPNAQTGNYSDFSVILGSVGVTDSSGSTVLTTSNMPNIVILDSGTAFTIIPQDLLDEIVSYFGAVNDPTYSYIVRCDLNGMAGTLDYQFAGPSGPVISVPFSELAVPLLDFQKDNPVPVTDDAGHAICRLGLSAPSTPDEPLLFGDTFLRSAYVVYDLDNLQIGIAQTLLNVTDSNVQAITASEKGQSLPGNVASVLSTPVLTATQGLNAAPTFASSAAATNVATAFGTGKGDAALVGVKTSYTNRATNIPGATTTAQGAGSTGKKKNASGPSGKEFAGGWWRGLLVQGVMVTIASLVGAGLII
jgi:hypothetical protein